MGILEAINNNFDNPDIEEPLVPGSYVIGFVNDAGNDDETEFDIYPGQSF